MRGIKRPVAVLLAFGTAFALTPMAAAQEAVTPKFQSLSTACSPGSDLTSTIRINLAHGNNCELSGTSEGFAATANLTRGSGDDLNRLTGRAKAIATPGTYQAMISCVSNRIVNQFTITTPPSPGNPAPRPKPPIVKPAGAPDTGGGGTA